MQRALWRPLFISIGAGSTLSLAALAAPAAAQPSQEEIQARFEMHKGDFDYLLGDWSFSARNKTRGPFKGRWSAVRLATGEGAHILDEYRVIGEDGQTQYVSSTLRAYNVFENRWELISAETGGGLLNFGSAQRSGDEMHIEQSFGVAAGVPSTWRIRYYDIGPQSFSWSADRSTDGGKTWDQNYMELEARRTGPPRSLDPLAQ